MLNYYGRITDQAKAETNLETWKSCFFGRQKYCVSTNLIFGNPMDLHRCKTFAERNCICTTFENPMDLHRCKSSN